MLCPTYCAVEQPPSNHFCEEDCAAAAARIGSSGRRQRRCISWSACARGADAIDGDGFCARCGHRSRVAPERDHAEIVLSPGWRAISDLRGLKHHRNEDALALESGPGGDILVVCDGVSRSQNPDVASMTAAIAACQPLHEAVQASTSDARPAVAAAIRAAKVAVLALPISKKDKDDPPETTIVVALRRGRVVNLGWVGDSRAYYVGPTGIRQLTVDHSWFNEVVAAGQVTAEEALRSPLVHALTRTLAGRSKRERRDRRPADVLCRRIAVGTRVSDSLLGRPMELPHGCGAAGQSDPGAAGRGRRFGPRSCLDRIRSQPAAGR